MAWTLPTADEHRHAQHGLFPSAANQTHTFTVQDVGSPSIRYDHDDLGDRDSTPVQNVKVITTPSGPVGYMLFNDHIATAEDHADRRDRDVAGNGAVTDLVLDIRYNGGGFLDLASELAFMIAGPGTHDWQDVRAAAVQRQAPDARSGDGRGHWLQFHFTARPSASVVRPARPCRHSTSDAFSC